MVFWTPCLLSRTPFHRPLPNSFTCVTVAVFLSVKGGAMDAQQILTPAEQILASWAGNFLILYLFRRSDRILNHWAGVVLGCLPTEYLGKNGPAFVSLAFFVALGWILRGCFPLQLLPIWYWESRKASFPVTSSEQKVSSGWRYPVGEGLEAGNGECRQTYLILSVSLRNMRRWEGNQTLCRPSRNGFPFIYGA